MASSLSLYAGAGFNVSAVLARALTVSNHSWEYGTAAEALLELDNPELSVFGDKPFPGDGLPPIVAEIPSLQYAGQFIRLDNETLVDGDGAVGDPAALGVSAVLLGQQDDQYSAAAQRQADFILQKAPRYQNGAISHREALAELWADFTYMAPPFLAYQGVATNNQSLLREAGRQCQLQQDILRPQSHKPTRGLWRHIIGPSDAQDLGLWATGNAWAAAGMTRVLATMLKWGPSKAWKTEQDQLKRSIIDILDGAAHGATKGKPPLLCNYLDDATWFGDAASTALIAAVTYRMAVLAPTVTKDRHLQFADRLRKAIIAHVDNATGLVAPTVNSLDWKSRTPSAQGSPEGQSFTVLMYAAYRDYLKRHK
ncbi:MAG: hypothetical protein LQ342_002473 [Letrouitia transgressa]|nr:MAG: hypothetical protein LQ342_002473 [Letrouitia transgressa]